MALSLGLPPPAVNRHRFSVEPGLSSTFLRMPRSPGHLTDALYAGCGQQSSQQAGAFVVPDAVEFCGAEMALEAEDDFLARR